VKFVAEKTQNKELLPAQGDFACPLRIIDCGLADYREILQLQHQMQEKRRLGKIQNTVLIVEHPSVITFGARQSANKLLANRDDLAKKHIDIVDIRRGGGTTAHNPGQLIFYPILNLQELNLGISEYIRKLESIGAELLEQSCVHAEIKKGLPGLWVDEKKIASIGVRVSKFITYHGMAINIKNDLSIFEFITPCGLDGVEMTSVLEQTGKHCSIPLAKKRLSQLLIRHFQ
jgi:lipoate-protein ligase B